MHISKPATLHLLPLLLWLVLSLFATALKASEGLHLEGWEYRWGDSPFQQDTPLWLIEEEAEAW